MSMRYSKFASRSFIIGSKLCPPATSRAVLPSRLSSPMACSTLAARSYSNGAGTCMFRAFRRGGVTDSLDPLGGGPPGVVKPFKISRVRRLTGAASFEAWGGCRINHDSRCLVRLVGSEAAHAAARHADARRNAGFDIRDKDHVTVFGKASSDVSNSLINDCGPGAGESSIPTTGDGAPRALSRGKGRWSWRSSQADIAEAIRDCTK